MVVPHRNPAVLRADNPPVNIPAAVAADSRPAGVAADSRSVGEAVDSRPAVAVGTHRAPEAAGSRPALAAGSHLVLAVDSHPVPEAGSRCRAEVELVDWS